MSDKTDAVLLTLPREELRQALKGVRVIEARDPAALDPADRTCVRALITSGVEPLGAAQFDLLPNLARVVTMGSGSDGVDAAAAAARGIEICTGRGANAGAVAELAVALFLAAVRRVVEADAHVRGGGWTPRELRPVRSVGSMAVGLVGLGAIGLAVGERLAPFGCRLAWTGPRPKPAARYPYVAELLDLARESDALIVAAPLTPETRGMIDAEVIAALGPQGLLVNVGRGGLVDEAALIAALRSGTLGGAALDVFEQEPTPPERWAGVPNTVLSPHTAGVTFQSYTALVDLAADHARGALR
jgi:hydroxypyruvate reductase